MSQLHSWFHCSRNGEHYYLFNYHRTIVNLQIDSSFFYCTCTRLFDWLVTLHANEKWRKVLTFIFNLYYIVIYYHKSHTVSHWTYIYLSIYRTSVFTNIKQQSILFDTCTVIKVVLILIIRVSDEIWNSYILQTKKAFGRKQQEDVADCN